MQFSGNEVEQFDVFRLCKTDLVEFSVVREGNDWRAVKITVQESCAQQYEAKFAEDRTVLLTQGIDLNLAGFHLPDLMYRRMCAAASDWYSGLEKIDLGGFMKAAILEKIERQERAFDAGGVRKSWSAKPGKRFPKHRKPTQQRARCSCGNGPNGSMPLTNLRRRTRPRSGHSRREVRDERSARSDRQSLSRDGFSRGRPRCCIIGAALPHSMPSATLHCWCSAPARRES